MHYIELADVYCMHKTVLAVVLDRHRSSPCNCMRVMHMCEANCLYRCLKLKCIIAVSLLIELCWVHLEGISYLQFCCRLLFLLYHGQADCEGLKQQDFIGIFSCC
jgi:hypothetical protein